MPILDMIVDCAPDAVHSLDPQGGVDLAEVKKLYGDKVCLIGNVNCGKMQTGTMEELEEDVRRSLRQGMPGYGYIFSTSNCAYTGLGLDRYERMNQIWWEEGCIDRKNSRKMIYLSGVFFYISSVRSEASNCLFASKRII